MNDAHEPDEEEELDPYLWTYLSEFASEEQIFASLPDSDLGAEHSDPKSMEASRAGSNVSGAASTEAAPGWVRVRRELGSGEPGFDTDCIFVNRCPSCRRIASTPRSTVCSRCGGTWSVAGQTDILDFECAVARHFPMLVEELLWNPGLLHLQMGCFYRHVVTRVQADDWEKVSLAFRLLEDQMERSGWSEHIENAVRVSFLECFDFDGKEERVLHLFGPLLRYLYDDQMIHMDALPIGWRRTWHRLRKPCEERAPLAWRRKLLDQSRRVLTRTS